MRVVFSRVAGRVRVGTRRIEEPCGFVDAVARCGRPSRWRGALGPEEVLGSSRDSSGRRLRQLLGVSLEAPRSAGCDPASNSGPLSVRKEPS